MHFHIWLGLGLGLGLGLRCESALTPCLYPEISLQAGYHNTELNQRIKPYEPRAQGVSFN